MRPWILCAALVTGCAGQPAANALELRQAATRIEQSCGVPVGSLLHPTRGGDLLVQPSASAIPSYSVYVCVMTGFKDEKLAEQGVRIILVGEDAPD
jgi:hypothetical protein